MIKTQLSPISADSYREFTLQNHLEAGLNLSDAYMSSVLSLSGEIVGGYAEQSGGEIRYGGRISFNVVYGDETPERIESGAEFSFKRPAETDSAEVGVRFELGGVTLKQSGGMLSAVAVVNAHITMKVHAEVDYLKDIECLKRMQEFECCDSTVEARGTLELDDEFECEKISKVIESTLTPTLTSVTAQEGSFLCDGEAILSLAMIPASRGAEMIRETRVIPFRYELDADLAHEGMAAFAGVETKSLALKVYVDEESGSSRIASAISVSVRARATGVSSMTAVVDADSAERELRLERKTVEMRAYKDFYSKTEHVGGKFNCDVPENSRFLGLIGVYTQVVSEPSDSGRDVLISADALFVDGENKTVSRRAELPVRLESAPNGEYSDYSADLVSITAKLRSGKIECEATFRVSCAPFETREIPLVVGVQEGDEKPVNNAAISVYLASAGDDEWAVSRELGVPAETLYELNPDLAFPLRGGEKIICFRKK